MISTWTREEDDTLRRMWMSGCKVKDMVPQRSASSISERAKKIGLPSKKVNVGRWAYSAPECGSVPTVAKLTPLPILQAVRVPSERASRLAILHLSSRTCRWPIGNPSQDDFHFCCDTPRRGSPYCGAHHAEAYVRWPG